MAFVALVSFLATLTSGLVVGVRLLAAARRNRKLPELTIGLSAVLITVGTLANLALLRLGGAEAAPTLAASAMLFELASASSLALANWRIFRPSRRWAAAAWLVSSAAMCALWLTIVLSGKAVYAGDSTPQAMLLRGLRLGVYAWGAIECFLYHSQLRRRLRLGLADPVIAHQILLWGISASAMTLILAIAIFTSFVMGTPPLAVPAALMALSVLGMVSAFGIWFAFFPPSAYRKLVGSRYAVPGA